VLAEAHHIAVGARAPHPNAARLFVDVFTSKLGLLALAGAGEFVLLPGVYPPIKDADKVGPKIVLMESPTKEEFQSLSARFREIFFPK